MSKDMWFDEFERLYNEAAEVADGHVSDAVYDNLADRADRAYRERLADMIDHARLLKKEGRL